MRFSVTAHTSCADSRVTVHDGFVLLVTGGMTFAVYPDAAPLASRVAAAFAQLARVLPEGEDFRVAKYAYGAQSVYPDADDPVGWGCSLPDDPTVVGWVTIAWDVTIYVDSRQEALGLAGFWLVAAGDAGRVGVLPALAA